MNTVQKVQLIEVKRAATPIESKSLASTKASSLDDNKVILTLYYNGMICDCNNAGSKLLGYLPTELIWQHISRLLPQLKEIALLQGQHLNPYLCFLSHVGHHFEVVSLSGARFVGELFFREVENLGRHFLRVIICPVEQEPIFS